MPRTLFDCIGDWYEDVLQTQFPDLIKVHNENGTRPDFEGNAFLAEAKVGFWDYGAQLKEAQVKSFTPNGKPIVYIVGYHNAEGLKQASQRMNEQEIDDMLKRDAGMHSAYFVSNSMIKKLWGKEKHVAASNPEWKYFSVRPRHLDAIINNKAFERNGVRYMPSRWYRICRPDMLLQPAPLLRGRKRNLKFGAILDREIDEPVIDYLAKRGLI